VLIGIDGRPFHGALAGTGRYITELCRALDLALPEANFLVYGNGTLALPVSGGRWRQRGGDSFLTSHSSPAQWYFLHAGSLRARMVLMSSGERRIFFRCDLIRRSLPF
jgi:hypothetical protein